MTNEPYGWSSCYRIRDRTYVMKFAVTPNGAPLMHGEPEIVGTDPAELGAAIMRAIDAHGAVIIPHPSASTSREWRKPIWNAAKSRSEGELEAKARYISVRRLPVGLVFFVTMKKRGQRGYTPLEKATMTVPTTITSEEVGRLPNLAFDACEII